MEIQELGISTPNIKGVEIPVIDATIPVPRTDIFIGPPVVVNIGLPIVDVPGCVEAHETNNAKNNQIKTDDQRGTYVVCDGGIPSYNPINFEPEQIIPTAPAGVDTREKENPKPPGQVELPQAAPPATAKVDCPTAAQQSKEPVGTYVEGFRKKVVEYKLIGNECVQITEAVPLPQQIVAGLPSGGQVVQVGGVAVIATASALLAKPLADILLKAVKPTVKKVMKKIATIRKKPIPVLSSGERRAEQRQMNHAVRELRSVFPRKKKRKG
jgi:hypothetical protein